MPYIIIIAISVIISLLIISELIYRDKKNKAYNKLLSNIYNANSIRELTIYNGQLYEFKKNFTNDDRGSSYWIALNNLYDEVEGGLN